MTSHANTCPASIDTRDGCSCATSIVHACPPSGSALTACCSRVPFELPDSDRITRDPSLVTCREYAHG